MAGWMGGTELFNGPLSLEQKVARVKSVTPADVQRVARRVFRRERLTVACVGALAKKLEKQVRAVVDAFE
jgi:predicted Zn-dependent peptidase